MIKSSNIFEFSTRPRRGTPYPFPLLVKDCTEKIFMIYKDKKSINITLNFLMVEKYRLFVNGIKNE